MKQIHSIFTKALLVALLTMTAQTAWADEAVTLSVDNDIAEGTAGHYYVNMLSSGTSILTLNDASVTTFKVYDDGGKDNHYAYTGNSTLKITVPIGYVIGIAGTAKSEDTTWDYWKIYKGHVYSDGTLFDGKDKSNPTSINVQTTGNKTAIYFHKGKSSYSDDTRNLELTVTLIPDPTYAKDIGRANVSGMESVYSYTGSELSASYSVYSYIDNELLTKGTAYTETITKDGVETEFKEEGYYTLTITGKDPYFGSQSFTLRIKNDSPELRQDGSEWFVNMPYSGTHTPTLDGNIPTFKIYDDGGKGGGYSKGTAGNFSPGADGYLQIHAPSGYQVHLTGYVRTESERASLTVYDGNSKSASTLCENVHGTNSAANADSYKNVTVDVTSSGEDMLLHFDALHETWDAEGLILTASIGHSITVADGITHGSVSCDNFWIKGSSTTIPLTVTPDVGYSVNTVSYNDDSDHTLTPDVNGDYSFTMPDKPVSVSATFTPIVYSISYELAGGTVATNNPDNYTIESESFTLINPTRTGYEFTGWTGTGLDAASTNVTIVQGTTGNRSYTATWTPISYSISYNGVEGATNPNPANYTIESETITLDAPTKDGYTFVGWFDNAEFTGDAVTTIAAGSTGDKTFYAKWTLVTYDITYNGVEGATNPNPANYTIESETITLDAPTKDGYTFVGWFDNAEFTGDAVTTIAAGSTGDKTFYAKWTLVTYDITYNGVEGATNPNPAGYTIESETITLDALTKDGYTFAGWFDNAEFTGSAVTTIAHGSTGDKTFWAKWIQDMTYGGVTIKDNGTTKSATLDASQEGTVSITSDVVVNAVELNRDFTANQPATVMLPFSLGDGQTVSGGSFYKFSGVTKDGDVWKALFTEVATLKANTPYLFNPSATGQMTFDLNGGTLTLNTTTTGETGSTASNWEFRGTYAKVQWDGSASDPSDLSKTYGFAKGNATIAAGQFVHFAAGAWLKPMRCYLVYNGSTEGGTFQNAPSRTRGAGSTEELPQTITVVLLSSSGETTGIGTLDTKTGDITLDGWYTMDGRKLEGKPTKKGLYINNGRKIVIK